MIVNGGPADKIEQRDVASLVPYARPHAIDSAGAVQVQQAREFALRRCEIGQRVAVEHC